MRFFPPFVVFREANTGVPTDLRERHNRWYGVLWVIRLFSPDKLGMKEVDRHFEEIPGFYEGIYTGGVMIGAAWAGVFASSAIIAGWPAGVLAAGHRTFFWQIRFRQLRSARPGIPVTAANAVFNDISKTGVQQPGGV